MAKAPPAHRVTVDGAKTLKMPGWRQDNVVIMVKTAYTAATPMGRIVALLP